MAKIFTVANQKGGVGKTTTSINLAASLANYKKRILLVDMDPQGNATMGSGVNKLDLKTSVLDVLAGDADVSDSIQKSQAGGYDLLPSNGDLTAAEVELLEFKNKESRLRHALINVKDDFDFIISDKGDPTIPASTDLNCGGCKLKPLYDNNLNNYFNDTTPLGTGNNNFKIFYKGTINVMQMDWCNYATFEVDII